jgi:hypothetical protein
MGAVGVRSFEVEELRVAGVGVTDALAAGTLVEEWRVEGVLRGSAACEEVPIHEAANRAKAMTCATAVLLIFMPILEIQSVVVVEYASAVCGCVQSRANGRYVC